MSPIDDELRSALWSRTEALSVSPDLFAGVERRATRMRRRRVAGAVAGSALAVSALGLGGPMLVSSLTSAAPGPSEIASPEPSSFPEPRPRFALLLDDPWEYRGDPDVLATRQARQSLIDEWAARHSPPGAFEPLYGEVFEPSQQSTVVFAASDAEGAEWWGVAQSGESGWELMVDEPLAGGTTALAAALPGDEVSRLLLVSSPDVVAIDYAPDGVTWSAAGELARGVATVALDGDAATDRYRVVSPTGDVLVDAPAPDGELVGGEGEGPGTDTPLDVDTALYALELDDPWAYRGPAEATLHPDLGTQDERLFAEGGSDRDDGSWSQRPLLLVEDESTGLSVLMVLHRRGGEAYVTTTWQTQDEAPRHSEQAVRDGQLLVQSFLPDRQWLVALAAQQAGAVEIDLSGAGRAESEPGVGLWELPPDPPSGSILLYSEGDGLLYHSEPARRS